MTQTIPSVSLNSPYKWVDLNDVTGIAIGTSLVIQNIGKDDIKLTEYAGQPASNAGYNIIESKQYIILDIGNVGAWAKGLNAESLIQVEAV